MKEGKLKRKLDMKHQIIRLRPLHLNSKKRVLWKMMNMNKNQKVVKQIEILEIFLK
jgi:hypothetical protein